MVLYMLSHLTYPGGGTKFVLRTADRLAQMGLDVGILTISADENIIKDYTNVKYFFLDGPLPDTISYWLTFPSLMRRVARIISQLKVKVLFPHQFPASYWGFLYKRRNPDLPCVWYCHEPSSFVHNLGVINDLKGIIKYAALISNPLFQLVDRRLAHNADRILTNSRYTASLIQKIYHREAEVLYPVMLDIEKINPRSEKDNFIFTLGLLTKFKKVDLIIKALARLKQRGEAKIQLVIGGDGDEKPNLMKLVQGLGLNNQVKFAGRLTEEQVWDYFARARAVVFPTTNEPFGQIPLEAMACGTPVIASNSGGPRETVVNGKTGFLFKPGDEVDLAEKISLLVSDGRMIKEMSSAARKHVEAHFSFDNTLTRLYEILSPYCREG